MSSRPPIVPVMSDKNRLRQLSPPPSATSRVPILTAPSSSSPSPRSSSPCESRSRSSGAPSRPCGRGSNSLRPKSRHERRDARHGQCSRQKFVRGGRTMSLYLCDRAGHHAPHATSLPLLPVSLSSLSRARCRSRSPPPGVVDPSHPATRRRRGRVRSRPTTRSGSAPACRCPRPPCWPTGRC